MRTVLVTGCGGLIGSAAVSYFSKRGWKVIGVDNNMRRYFFGESGSVTWNIERLKKAFPAVQFYETEIRDERAVKELFTTHRFDFIIHAAAQPSHDWAAREPLTDFTVNANGTLIMLEALRHHAPEAVFAFMSTNKVYGDRPNLLPFRELPTRYELPEEHVYYGGIPETMGLDQCQHSLFGVSKAAADLMVQEYGRYFGLKTGVFRGGCLSGMLHSGVEQHGFLSYLVKCIVHGIKYTIYGYKQKQVRDNMHAYDVVTALHAFYEYPRPAAVYNIGGGRYANVSMTEAITKIEAMTGKKADITYVDTPRRGDHIWYVSSMDTFKRDFGSWTYAYSLDRMLEEMCAYEMEKK